MPTPAEHTAFLATMVQQYSEFLYQGSGVAKEDQEALDFSVFDDDLQLQLSMTLARAIIATTETRGGPPAHILDLVPEHLTVGRLHIVDRIEEVLF